MQIMDYKITDYTDTDIDRLYIYLANKASYCKKDTVVIYQDSYYAYKSGDNEKAKNLLVENEIPIQLKEKKDKLINLL